MFDNQQFFDRYVAFEPEEACTLGVAVDAGLLRDLSVEGAEERSTFYQETLETLSHPPQEAADAGQVLDHEVLQRHCEWELFAHKRGLHLRNAAWAMYPYTMLRYEIAQKEPSASELKDPKSDFLRRTAAVPRFFKDLETSLLLGQESGLMCHQNHYQCLIEYELPGAAKFLAQLDVNASQAIEQHIKFLKEDLLPHAPELSVLGEEAYSEGLKITHGLDSPLQNLVEEAQADLLLTQESMIAAAERLFPSRTFSSFENVAEVIAELQEETLENESSVEGYYRKIIGEVGDHMDQIGEFRKIDDQKLGMSEYPEGMRDVGPGTNWPAPLLDPEGQGQFVIHPDPKAHSKSWAPVLAVHEGIPGHYLQSQGFRKAFSTSTAPIRFLCVADDVAIPRGNFCSMLNIEGYAVYAEECVRLSGYHEGQAELFALTANALRCVRVIAEIDFHRGHRSADETSQFVMANAGLPSAEWELERYQRGPFQSPSYYFGAKAFRHLRNLAEKQQGSRFHAADFHEKLFSYGPALPQSIEADLIRPDVD